MTIFYACIYGALVGGFVGGFGAWLWGKEEKWMRTSEDRLFRAALAKKERDRVFDAVPSYLRHPTLYL